MLCERACLIQTVGVLAVNCFRFVCLLRCVIAHWCNEGLQARFPRTYACEYVALHKQGKLINERGDQYTCGMRHARSVASWLVPVILSWLLRGKNPAG